MDRMVLGIFLLIAVGSVLFLIFGSRRAVTRARTSVPSPTSSGTRSNTSAEAWETSNAPSTSGDLELEEIGSTDEAGRSSPTGDSWMTDAEAQTGANRSSLLEDEGLARARFKSPAEKEEGEKYSRSIFQPLEVTLFDQDKRDDLTRDSTSSDRSFNLFAVDEKNDLTRSIFEDDEKR